MVNRYINLDGTYNFRDMGGYVGHDNKKVVMNRLYRSDTLSNLSDEDVKVLEDLDLRIIVDYRSSRERENNEDVHISGTVLYHLDPIAHVAQLLSDVHRDDHLLNKINEDVVTDIFVEQNKRFVTDVNSKKTYKKLIELALENNDGSLVHHCTAGKDRTGFGSALIHMLLGVSEEDIYRDFLQTNINLNNKLHQLDFGDNSDPKINEVMNLFQGVKKEYIQSAINEINEEFDGAENYAINELGFSINDINKLREMYLEDEN